MMTQQEIQSLKDKGNALLELAHVQEQVVNLNDRRNALLADIQDTNAEVLKLSSHRKRLEGILGLVRGHLTEDCLGPLPTVQDVQVIPETDVHPVDTIAPTVVATTSTVSQAILALIQSQAETKFSEIHAVAITYNVGERDYLVTYRIVKQLMAEGKILSTGKSVYAPVQHPDAQKVAIPVVSTTHVPFSTTRGDVLKFVLSKPQTTYQEIRDTVSKTRPHRKGLSLDNAVSVVITSLLRTGKVTRVSKGVYAPTAGTPVVAVPTNNNGVNTSGWSDTRVEFLGFVKGLKYKTMTTALAQGWYRDHGGNNKQAQEALELFVRRNILARIRVGLYRIV